MLVWNKEKVEETGNPKHRIQVEWLTVGCVSSLRLSSEKELQLVRIGFHPRQNLIWRKPSSSEGLTLGYRWNQKFVNLFNKTMSLSYSMGQKRKEPGRQLLCLPTTSFKPKIKIFFTRRGYNKILLVDGTKICQRTIFMVNEMSRNLCDYLSYMTGSHLFRIGSYMGSFPQNQV